MTRSGAQSAARPLGRHNPRVVALRRIARGEDPALTVIDGRKLVLEAAASGVALLELFLGDTIADDMRNQPALRSLFRSGAVYTLDHGVLERLAPTRSSQGVLATLRIPKRSVPIAGIVVFLAGVQDPGNLGAVVRAAAALGASGVACSTDCANPFSARAIRASAGQALVLPIEADVEFADLAAEFRNAGGMAAAAVGQGGSPLGEWVPQPPLLVAFGNEGHGLPAAVLDHVGSKVTIPLGGGVESLNIAVATGVLLAALTGVASSPILKVQS